MILFEDKDIIVYHKPAGIPVQSAAIGQVDLVSKLNNYLGKDMIHVVHRLDQPVEGIIVLAKTKQAAAELGKQVTDGRMKKMYRAVCCYQMSGDEKEVDGKCHQLIDYLVKDGRKNVSTVTGKDRRDAKKAELSFRVLAKKRMTEDHGELLLTEIELKTGRHHQIRVQMSHAGFPLYGDRKYNEKWERFLTNEEQLQLALCAVSLTFFHPRTKKTMDFAICQENKIFAIFENL